MENMAAPLLKMALKIDVRTSINDIILKIYKFKRLLLWIFGFLPPYSVWDFRETPSIESNSRIIQAEIINQLKGKKRNKYTS